MRDDSLYHSEVWESWNPGYWQIKDGSLRRRLSNYGDRARRTGFPFHYETHQKSTMPVDYDPSLPAGVKDRRDWNLTGYYAILISATVRQVAGVPEEGDSASSGAWAVDC